MIFKNVKARDFGSFKSLDYNFSSSPVLVQGENLSDDSQESNGSGKSFINSAIEYCLFKSTRKVKDIELVRHGQKEAYLSLEIYCPIRKETLLIERKIKVKGSGASQLSINGEILHSFEDKMVAEIDTKMFDWIDVSKEDLQNYYIVNKERYKSIFSSSNREKMALISRFSKSDLIDGIDEFVKADVKILEAELASKKSTKDSIIGKIKVYKEEIDNELDRDIEADRAQQINDINSEIKLVEDSIRYVNRHNEEIEASIKYKLKESAAVERKLKRVEKILSEVAGSDCTKDLEMLDEYIKSNSDSLKSKEKDLSRLVHNRREVEDIISDIEKNITGAVTCPKCKHEFLIGDPDIDIEDEREAKHLSEDILKGVGNNIQKIKAAINSIESEAKALQSDKSILMIRDGFSSRWTVKLNKMISRIVNEFEGLNRDMASKKKEVEYNNESIRLKRKSIKEKEASKDAVMLLGRNDKLISEYRVKLKEQGKVLYSVNKDINILKISIFDTEQWITNFKKFNMHLANRSLATIQTNCNKFLESIKSDIQVRWEGFKVLGTGKLKEEITSYIYRNGEERDFWSFSGGERARLDISMILTLQGMINSTHKYGGLQFLSLDEIGEGTDAQGLSDIMKSLSVVEKTIMITTHVVNRNIGENILLVRKVNDVSTLVK